MSRKVFVSHCHKDKIYVDEFVKLLKDFGFREKDIFYSSSATMGVEPGQIIFERLKEELDEQPIVLYFLSENYYNSVPCLNEMGASWMVTEKHYPIALPGFSPRNITGAIDDGRLAICLNKDTKTEEVLNVMEKICMAADVEFPSKVKLEAIKYIQPFCLKIEKLIRWDEFLEPNDEGVFEVILGKEGKLSKLAKEKYFCFKLPQLIHPNFLGLDDLSEKDIHWLFFHKESIEFKEGDKVRFNLNEECPYAEKIFKGLVSKNIYSKEIEKID